MKVSINMNAVYAPSADVVARELDDELIIVPITSGIGDMEDDLFTLNRVGREIWARLDGKRRLDDIVAELDAEYDAPAGEIAKDTEGFIAELLERKMLHEIHGD